MCFQVRFKARSEGARKRIDLAQLRECGGPQRVVAPENLEGLPHLLVVFEQLAQLDRLTTKYKPAQRRALCLIDG